MKRTCTVKMLDFGSLKALVSVQMGDMEIRGFKVIDQGDGNPWVASPSREINRNGNKEYFNIVRFNTSEARQEFKNWILGEYNNHRKEEN